jgi:Zn-dependent protease with chaperone function
MDFFAHQDDARRRSRLLLIYYFFAVAAIIVATHATVAFLFVFESELPSPQSNNFFWDQFYNLKIFAAVAGVILLVITTGTLIKLYLLRDGGHAVAQALGGRRIFPDTKDLVERRVLNVIEEMSIASGVPVPTLYIMEEEEAINAFAAGFSFQDAVIGITRGCATRLTRDELQGVIAHEFSHILNADMRLNIRLIGILNGILGIYITGRVILSLFKNSSGSSRSSRRSGKDGGGLFALLILAIALIIIGLVGAFFARVIQSAVSRQREYLADASAVQFTRNPLGISGALKKIGGLVQGSKIESGHASEASHMFFSEGFTSWYTSIFATHPPLESRIKRLEPSFQGEFPKIGGESIEDIKAEVVYSAFLDSFDPRSISVNPQKFIDSIGTVSADSLERAQALIWSLPEELRGLAHSWDGAQAICFLLLLSADNNSKDKGMVYLLDHFPEIGELVSQKFHLIKGVKVGQRLPLLDLAIPALRTMDIGVYKRFNEALSGFLQVDNKPSIFEFILVSVLHHSVEKELFKLQSSKSSEFAVAQLTSELAVVLAALAKASGAKAVDSALFFNAGFDEIGFGGIEDYVKYAGHEPAEVCAAVNKLNLASPMAKREILKACARVVSKDGIIAPAEAELLRGVCESIDCPMPQL